MVQDSLSSVQYITKTQQVQIYLALAGDMPLDLTLGSTVRSIFLVLSQVLTISRLSATITVELYFLLTDISAPPTQRSGHLVVIHVPQLGMSRELEWASCKIQTLGCSACMANQKRDHIVS